jgi:predicted dehydrogenase
LKKVHLALVGCGGVARKRHIPAIALLKQAGIEICSVVACCDTVAQNAEQAAVDCRRLGLGDPRIYASWEEVIRDGIAEAIDVCLPHGLHHVVGIAALDAELHVFMEKPFAVSIRTGRALAEAAERAGRVLAVGVPYRRAPGQRAVNWAINEERLIGEPRLFFANYTQLRPPVANLTPAHLWRRDRVMGGGSGIIDSGFHFLDSVRYFFGECEQVYAELRTSSPGRNAILTDRENIVVVVLSFANGVVGTWCWSFDVPGHETRNIVFYGSEGSIEDTGYSHWLVIYKLFQGQVELRLRDGTYLGMEELLDRFRTAIGPDRLERLFPGGVGEPFALELWDFFDAILNQRDPEVDGWDGLRTLALADAIYESSLTGSAVRVEDILTGNVGSAWQADIDARWASAP